MQQHPPLRRSAAGSIRWPGARSRIQRWPARAQQLPPARIQCSCKTTTTSRSLEPQRLAPARRHPLATAAAWVALCASVRIRRTCSRVYARRWGWAWAPCATGTPWAMIAIAMAAPQMPCTSFWRRLYAWSPHCHLRMTTSVSYEKSGWSDRMRQMRSCTRPAWKCSSMCKRVPAMTHLPDDELSFFLSFNISLLLQSSLVLGRDFATRFPAPAER